MGFKERWCDDCWSFHEEDEPCEEGEEE